MCGVPVYTHKLNVFNVKQPTKVCATYANNVFVKNSEILQCFYCGVGPYQ